MWLRGLTDELWLLSRTLLRALDRERCMQRWVARCQHSQCQRISVSSPWRSCVVVICYLLQQCH